MKAKNLIEMAMDPGEGGHLIYPGKRRKIDTGETPLHKLPAFPPGDYGEKTASKAFGNVLQGVQRATGRSPRALSQHTIMMTLMQTLQRVQGIERRHRSELENLAIKIVLDLPEFKDAKADYEEGYLKINARLLPQMPQAGHQAQQARIEAPDPDEEMSQELGLGVPEIQAEITPEVQKRKFLNLMIQGAAVSKTSAYHLASDALSQMDPQLVSLYGTLVALGDLSYWMKPDDMFGGMQGGEESLSTEENEDGEEVNAINASAINFPILVHELVKGLYELAVHTATDEDSDETLRQHVFDQADTLADEEWQIMHGPAMWMHFNHMMNKLGAHEYIPRVVNKIASLPASEFAERARQIFTESPEGLVYLKSVVDEVTAESEE
jgi:hypothetical protein